MAEKGGCAICGTTIKPSQGGRPRSFCSVACRRMAENETRRIERRLESLERSRDRIAWALIELGILRNGGIHAKRLLEAEREENARLIAAATTRQRELYARLSLEDETPPQENRWVTTR